MHPKTFEETRSAGFWIENHSVFSLPMHMLHSSVAQFLNSTLMLLRFRNGVDCIGHYSDYNASRKTRCVCVQGREGVCKRENWITSYYFVLLWLL